MRADRRRKEPMPAKVSLKLVAARLRRLGARHAAILRLARAVGYATRAGVADRWGVTWRDVARCPDTRARRRIRCGGARATGPARARCPALVRAPANRGRGDRLVVRLRVLRAGSLLGGRGIPR